MKPVWKQIGDQDLIESMLKTLADKVVRDYKHAFRLRDYGDSIRKAAINSVMSLPEYNEMDNAERDDLYRCYMACGGFQAICEEGRNVTDAAIAAVEAGEAICNALDETTLPEVAQTCRAMLDEMFMCN